MILRNNEDLARALTKLSMLAPELKEKPYEVEIKPYKERRSKNANNYSWLLQGEIAKKLNRRIDDIHNEMVLQYGVIEVFSIVKEALPSAIRAFDYYEIKGESQLNGKTFVHIKAAIGTHLYNTAEMAKFIDGVVAEAQDLDIETRTPQEIEEMKSLWQTA